MKETHLEPFFTQRKQWNVYKNVKTTDLIISYHQNKYSSLKGVKRVSQKDSKKHVPGQKQSITHFQSTVSMPSLSIFEITEAYLIYANFYFIK